MRLHPTQSTVYQSPSRFVVCVAGRRWGKTTEGKAKGLSWIATRGYRGARFAYVAPTYTEGRRTLWAEFKSSIPVGWVGKIDESRLEITFVNGSTWYLLGADNFDSLRGPGWDGLHLDEYATMKPEAWTEVLRPALIDRKGVALFTGTPQSYNHFYDLYQRGLQGEPDWASFHFKTVEAEARCERCSRPVVKVTATEWDCEACGIVGAIGHLERAEIEAARRDLDERTYRQEFEASFEALSGRVYYAFRRDRHVAPVVLDRYAPVCVSFDFNIDPATAVIGQVDAETGVASVWREVYLTHHGGEATQAAASKVRALLREAGHSGSVRLYGDSTGKAGKTTGPSDHAVLRAEFMGATWRIPHGQPHVRDRIAAVNGRSQSAAGVVRLRVDPICTRLITDLEAVQFTEQGDLDKSSNPALTHVSDALGYWLVRDFPPVVRSRVGGARVA